MAMTSKYKWFKAADSTEWVRMPMEEAVPLLIKPKLAPQAGEKKPVDPKPERALAAAKLPEEEVLSPQDIEVNRIWSEYYKKREREAQQKPATNPEADRIRAWVA